MRCGFVAFNHHGHPSWLVVASLLGPPRATMWAHLEQLGSGETLLAVSPMTQGNPDREYVRERIQGPLETVVVPGLQATVELVPGNALSNQLRSRRILGGRLVPVAELGSEADVRKQRWSDQVLGRRSQPLPSSPGPTNARPASPRPGLVSGRLQALGDRCARPNRRPRLSQ